MHDMPAQSPAPYTPRPPVEELASAPEETEMQAKTEHSASVSVRDTDSMCMTCMFVVGEGWLVKGGW